MQLRVLCILLLNTLTALADEPKTVRIAMVGDSTMASYTKPPADRPTLTGWGQVFGEHFKDNVEIMNLASSGRDIREFVDEKRWQKALDAKPDYIFIQFGHNDSGAKGLAPEEGFREYLLRYVAEARKAGATPVLVTPVGVRSFKEDKVVSKLTLYGDAMKKVAKEQKVPLIDLQAKSMAHYEKLGDAGSSYISPSAADRVHFSRKGAQDIARLVAEEIPANVPDLKAMLK